MVKILAALLLFSLPAFGQGFQLTDTAFLGQVNMSMQSTYDPRIISGLQLWISADNGVYTDAAKSTPATTGSSVYTWANRSLSNTFTDLVQPDSSLRPVYRTTSGINGQPHIHFDTSYLTNSSSSFSQPYTMVACLTTTNCPATGFGIIYWMPGAQVSLTIPVGNYGTALVNPQMFAGGSTVANKGIGTNTTVGGLILSYFSGVTSDVEINSTNAWPGGGGVSTSAFQNGQMGGGSLGATYRLQGEMYEFMFFNKNLSTTERSNVTYYLKHKYNLPANNVQ